MFKGMLGGLVFALIALAVFKWALVVFPGVHWGSFWTGVVTTIIVSVVGFYGGITLMWRNRW